MYLQELLAQRSQEAERVASASKPPALATAARTPRVAPQERPQQVVDGDEELQWLTYRQAAVRVGRDVRSIKRWRRNGMPTRAGANGVSYVHVDDLTKWWRARMLANPTRSTRRGTAPSRG